MSQINLRWEGRFGNHCMQYLHAKAYARHHGCELRVTKDRLDKVFVIPELEPDQGLPCVQDWDLYDRVDITIDGYALHQDAMTYTRKEAREWLRFRPEIQEKLDALPKHSDKLFHVRRGDYVWSDYILVSGASYINAARQFGYDPLEFDVIEEAKAEFRPQPFENALSFVPDFWRLMQAKILFRSNSTFPWVAALLGNAEHVYSPTVAGMKSAKQADLVGIPQDVPFVEGNWPAISWQHDHCTDLHVREE